MDRAKVQGYHRKWIEGRYLLGCAVFVDLLTPCSIFSKMMQSDEVDILAALTALLKTMKETDKFNSKSLDQWPTYGTTIKKITCEHGEMVYQCQELRKFSDAQSYYQNHFQDYCSRVTECIRSRMAWSNLQLMRDIIFMLGSQG